MRRRGNPTLNASKPTFKCVLFGHVFADQRGDGASANERTRPPSHLWVMTLQMPQWVPSCLSRPSKRRHEMIVSNGGRIAGAEHPPGGERFLRAGGVQVEGARFVGSHAMAA